MQEFGLSFALTSFVAPDVIEITPHREIEITQDMIRELQTKVLARTDAYVKLLINRKNPHSHTFGAMQAIRQLDVKAVAVFAENSIANKTSETLFGDSDKLGYALRIFTSRNDALHWLASLS